MKDTGQKYLMMIEPKGKAEKPIDDGLTELARKIWKRAKAGPATRGFHVCACGASSDNIIWMIGNIETNSLLVHYVESHRSEVPEIEIKKITELEK